MALPIGWHRVATAGGAGFAPKAPGTAGSIVGVLIYLLIEGLHAGAYYLHAIIFFFIVGIWASSRVEHLWGHDSQRIVIDEVVGQMITFGLAAGRYQLSAFYILLGFGLFRLFDICETLSNSASGAIERRARRDGR